MTPGWEQWFLSDLPLFGLTIVCAHLVMSCGQTLMHFWLGHHRLGGRLFHNHINFHHTYYARGHLASAVYRGTEGNNTPYFLIQREFPRLCRGGSKSLTVPGVYAAGTRTRGGRMSGLTSASERMVRSLLNPSRLVVAFSRLRKGPFEGPATVKPPALPEDSYYRPSWWVAFWDRMLRQTRKLPLCIADEPRPAT